MSEVVDGEGTLIRRAVLRQTGPVKHAEDRLLFCFVLLHLEHLIKSECKNGFTLMNNSDD